MNPEIASRIALIGAVIILPLLASFGQPYFVSPAGDQNRSWNLQL